MADEIKAKYKCTETELYAVTNLGINNLESDLARFLAKSLNYTPLYVTGLRALRTAAMVLPDEEARNGVHQTLKGLLPALMETIKGDFNDLKGYIRAGWPTEKPEPRYEQAGLVSYNKIGSNNWEQVVTLHQSMRNFVNDAGNAVKLAIPGGMVVGFPGQIDTNFTAFNDTYQLYLTSRETGTARAAKITANNDLYDGCMVFMTFGVESVFRTDEANKKRYTFSALKDIISPPGSASLKVKVMRPDDTVVVDKPVTIKKEGDPAITVNTDGEGFAVFPNLNSGDYAGYVDVDGVRTNFVKEVNTGVDARITVIV